MPSNLFQFTFLSSLQKFHIFYFSMKKILLFILMSVALYEAFVRFRSYFLEVDTKIHATNIFKCATTNADKKLCQKLNKNQPISMISDLDVKPKENVGFSCKFKYEKTLKKINSICKSSAAVSGDSLYAYITLNESDFGLIVKEIYIGD